MKTGHQANGRTNVHQATQGSDEHGQSQGHLKSYIDGLKKVTNQKTKTRAPGQKPGSYSKTQSAYQ